MAQSEIRHSTINALLEKAAEKKYRKYLSKISLKKIRGFSDEPVSFDFPVTAIIGPNGGGKTTVLGAAACAYKEITPRRFFSKSGKYDQGMQDWTIEYEIVDKDINLKDTIRRTANFKNFRWNRDAVDRKILVFGVNRTVPASERSELLRCASNNFVVDDSNVIEMLAALAALVSRILGKDVTKFKELKIAPTGSVTLLTGSTHDGIEYSEFHFGAGESSIIRMVTQIETADEQSLILIEEIENGLHPVATIKLVEYLVDVAERKKAQVIFTTHSNEAIQPLPPKAIWVAMRNKIFQGKLDVKSLRAITGFTETKIVIFVEDDFAKRWVESALRQNDRNWLDLVEVHGMAGDGTAVAMNAYHNKNPAVKTKSICLIDGDSEQKENIEGKIYRLPGGQPEAYIFDAVMQKWDVLGAKLTLSLLHKYEETDTVFETCKQVRISNKDSHLLFSQIGQNLGFLPERTVIDAFTTIWAQFYVGEVETIATVLRSILPQGEGQPLAEIKA